MPGYVSPLIVAQVDGTAVTGTTIGSILPAQAVLTLPANYINVVGKKFHITATGRISNIVTTPGTLTLTVRLGGVTAAGASTAWALNTTAKTNVGWYLDLYMTVRSVGAAATLFCNGTFESESIVGAAAGVANTAMFQASAPAVGASFNSAAAQSVDLMATFSLTGNSIQLHSYSLFDCTTTP